MSDLSGILKPNATREERAMVQAILRSAPDLTVIPKLMNPDTCPADLLGWLAWSFSVRDWDTAWSETTKREVIRQAIAIHRTAGTVGAVRRILASLGMETEISEWFEHGGVSFTFRIDVLIEEVFKAGFHFSPELVTVINQVIDNVKPARSHFDLRIGERYSTNIHVRAATQSTTRSEIVHTPKPRTQIAAVTLSIRAHTQVRVVSDFTHNILTNTTTGEAA